MYNPHQEGHDAFVKGLVPDDNPYAHETEKKKAWEAGWEGAEIDAALKRRSICSEERWRFPGHGKEGPTLEIFQYNREEAGPRPAINRPGLAHLAFAVEDVAAAQAAVVSAGGGTVGDLVNLHVAGAGNVAFVYVTDPEGNIIELQKWLP
jgi:catechol 2,3-dioxygenase-like lactoylglutathione lyase family enzyme